MSINNEIPLKFVLWDSYGSPDYRNVWMTFVKGAYNNFYNYPGSMVNILFFDLSNKDSFIKLEDWVALVGEHGERDALLCLIGNKRAEVAPAAEAKFRGHPSK